MLENTGQISTFGRDNIFEATEVVYASLKDASHEAEKWVAQNKVENISQNETEDVVQNEELDK